MGVIYTQGSDPATLEPAQLSESLAAAVREAEVRRPEKTGKVVCQAGYGTPDGLSRTEESSQEERSRWAS